MSERKQEFGNTKEALIFNFMSLLNQVRNIYDILILRLFVLRIGKKKSNPQYRIFYGVISPYDEVMTSPSVSDFNELKKYGDKLFYSGIIKMACEKKRILGVYDDLLKGISLKEAFANWGIESPKINFDVSYNQAFVNVPWYEEKLLSQVTYSRMACMLEPARLFEIDGKIPNNANEGLKDLDELLKKNTNLPFGSKFDHVGNLEILLTPSRDEHGRQLISCEIVDKRKVLCVTIDETLLKNVKNVVVNARLLSNDKVVCDTIQSKNPLVGNNLIFEIPSILPIDVVQTKVWITDSSTTRLVYDSTICLLKRIVLNMNIVGQQIKATTDWLEKLKDNLPEKKVAEVDNAGKIMHGSTETRVIGDKDDKRSFGRRRTFRKIEKTKDMFFPNGWDAESDEIGKLSFLEWFKQQSNDCATIFLQDPYFEDVALFFLASIETLPEIVVLTQTRLKTNTDNTCSFVPCDEDGERKNKILNYIKSYPTLLGAMRLKILDVPVANAVLHDRYLFFYRKNGSVDAFSLSNSMQGATNKQPLLVTQIGGLAWERLNEYISTQLNKYQLETIYDSRALIKTMPNENKEIADAGFYQWVKDMCKYPEQLDYGKILDDILYGNTLEKISTIGYCLATTSKEYEHVDKVVSIIKDNRTWIDVLKEYVLVHHYSNYPIGFIGSRLGFRDCNLTELLRHNLNELLTDTTFLTTIENFWGENFAYGVWGQCFACKILVKASGKDALDVLRQLRPTLCGVKTDVAISPVAKISNVLLQEILMSVIYYKNDELQKLMLVDKEDWLRSLGMLTLLTRNEECLFGTSVGLLHNSEEVIMLCQCAVMDYRFKNKQACYHILVEHLASRQPNECLECLKQVISKPCPIELRCEYVRQVIVPLINLSVLDRDEVEDFIIDQLFDLSIGIESHARYQGTFVKLFTLIDGDTQKIVDKSKVILKNSKFVKNRHVIHSNDSLFEVSCDLKCLEKVLVLLCRCYHDIWHTEKPQLRGIIDEIHGNLTLMGIAYD